MRNLFSILLVLMMAHPCFAAASQSFDDTQSDSATVAGVALGSNSVTVAAWVYINGFTEGTFTAGDDNTGIVVFNTRETGSDDSPTLMTSSVSGGAGTQQAAVFTADSDGMAVGCKGATTLTTGTWYFLTGVYARDTGIATFAGTWDVYLNGVKDNSSSNNFSLASSHDGSFEGATWRLANSVQWGGTSNVLIAYLQVFTRALNIVEINEIMRKPGSISGSFQAYVPLWDEDAISYDTTSTTSGVDSSFTFSHSTASNGNRLLIVAISWQSNTVTVSSVTYNSVSMTSVGASIDLTSTDPDIHTQLFRLIAPSTGANNVVVTFSGSTNAEISSSTFYGVNQTTPLGTLGGASSNGSSTVTVDITNASGDFVIDSANYGDSTETLTPGAGQTERWEINANSTVAAGSTEIATFGTTTMSWTGSGDGAPWVTTGVPIKPITGTLKDLSGNGYHGTPVGSSASSNGPPVLLPGGVSQ